MPVLDEVHILNLTVAPSARRRGLGRALLNRALDRAREVGATSAYLEVRVSNAAAIDLYRSAGFEEIAQRRDYYPAANGREDALILRKVLV
jgi:ribosomal-protein-alanine N-acetyltransferase